MKRLISFSLAAAMLLALGACSAPAPSEPPQATDEAAKVEKASHDCEACAKGEAGETVWCEHCSMGFVAGEKVTCKGCYDAAMAEKAGWCEHCSMGFVAGEKVTCKGCVEAALTGTECEACKEKAESEA